MKILVVVAAFVALCSGSALPPTVPGDNSHYVEGVSRYIWMPDSDGTPILVDLQQPVDDVPVESRNAGSQNRYLLFTRSNRNNAQVITHGQANSLGHYRGARPTKVIAHGWRNSGNEQWIATIRNAFLDVVDCNVIVVDWGRIAGNTNYNAVVRDVPSVGQAIGNFLVWLVNTAGGNWGNFHLMGHSLGAHAVGIAGRQAGGRPVRVTGMDPAGPGWGGNAQAINRNSGTYVECIHTDGRGTGIMTPLGDADFYPNGGRHPQPGCGVNNACSHGRAHEFFASTIRNNRLVGRRCVNLHEAELATCNGATLNMGNSILSKRGSGLFGLRTGTNWPF